LTMLLFHAVYPCLRAACPYSCCNFQMIFLKVSVWCGHCKMISLKGWN
jgi:hypothetical protein